MVTTHDGDSRGKQHRGKLRAAGLRPIQLWVPDTRQPGFAEEARRQSALVAAGDARDRGLPDFLEAGWRDIDAEENDP